MIQGAMFLIQVRKDVNQLLKMLIQRLKRLNQVLKKTIQGPEIAPETPPVTANSIIIRIGYGIVLNRRTGANFIAAKRAAAGAENAPP
jgi:hypothetical protein